MGSTGGLLCWRLYWRAALVGYSAGSTGGLLWWVSRRDPLASRSGGILLGGIHRPARRDALASRSGGILGGIHWQAALAGYSAGSTGEQLWRKILGGIHWQGYWVGAWCRSIANTDSNIKSNNPFLSGGEKKGKKQKPSTEIANDNCERRLNGTNNQSQATRSSACRRWAHSRCSASSALHPPQVHVQKSVWSPLNRNPCTVDARSPR